MMLRAPPVLGVNEGRDPLSDLLGNQYNRLEIRDRELHYLAGHFWLDTETGEVVGGPTTASIAGW